MNSRTGHGWHTTGNCYDSHPEANAAQHEDQSHWQCEGACYKHGVDYHYEYDGEYEYEYEYTGEKEYEQEQLLPHDNWHIALAFHEHEYGTAIGYEADGYEADHHQNDEDSGHTYQPAIADCWYDDEPYDSEYDELYTDADVDWRYNQPPCEAAADYVYDYRMPSTSPNAAAYEDPGYFDAEERQENVPEDGWFVEDGVEAGCPQTLAIKQDNRCIVLDDFIPPAYEICSRIEKLIISLLEGLWQPEPSFVTMDMIRRCTTNTEVYNGALGLNKDGIVRRGMTMRAAQAYARVWKILHICYGLLVHGQKATRRDIYYRLLGDQSKIFANEKQVYSAISDAAALLQCPRAALGITAASRSAVAGLLLIHDVENTINCAAVGLEGFSITGDIERLNMWKYSTSAQIIIVIEKDAVFQRLVEDGLFNLLPCILVTGRGFPDLAVRVLLRRLHDAFPHLPIVALVDWNPSGLAIICAYKYGSAGTGLETPNYACDVRWLGVRSGDLIGVPQEAFQPLTERDQGSIDRMLQWPLLESDPDYKEELHRMRVRGEKCEIQALHQSRDKTTELVEKVARKLARRDYV
eukprot:jgi/Chlat1/6460/Chrsp45S00467